MIMNSSSLSATIEFSFILCSTKSTVDNIIIANVLFTDTESAINSRDTTIIVDTIGCGATTTTVVDTSSFVR